MISSLTVVILEIKVRGMRKKVFVGLCHFVGSVDSVSVLPGCCMQINGQR